MNDDEKQVEQFQQNINKLPSEIRRAVCWLLSNIDFVDEMLKQDEISEKDLQRYINLALRNKDALLLVILYYQKAKNRKKGEPPTQ